MPIRQTRHPRLLLLSGYYTPLLDASSTQQAMQQDYCTATAHALALSAPSCLPRIAVLATAGRETPVASNNLQLPDPLAHMLHKEYGMPAQTLCHAHPPSPYAVLHALELNRACLLAALHRKDERKKPRPPAYAWIHATQNQGDCSPQATHTTDSVWLEATAAAPLDPPPPAPESISNLSRTYQLPLCTTNGDVFETDQAPPYSAQIAAASTLWALEHEQLDATPLAHWVDACFHSEALPSPHTQTRDQLPIGWGMQRAIQTVLTRNGLEQKDIACTLWSVPTPEHTRHCPVVGIPDPVWAGAVGPLRGLLRLAACLQNSPPGSYGIWAMASSVTNGMAIVLQSC